MMEKVKKIPQVKCGFCEVKSEKQLMIQDVNKKYYHKASCYDEFLANKAFKQREFEEKLKLSHKIAEIYELESIQLIPHQFYPYIEDVRNDSKLFGRLGKSYKTGIKYSGIALTYEYCRDIIREIHRTKEFKNFLMELRYGLAVIKNNLVDCKNDFEKRRLTEQSLLKTREVEEVVQVEIKKTQYKKEKDINDISEYLD